MTLAIVRGISAQLAAGEVTHIERQPVDVGVARAQHARYVTTLRELGCEVVELPAEDAFPDCVFIEDAAIVLDELAVITRPGAPSRRGETTAVAAALRAHRQVVALSAPATLDGGDVLRLGRRLYVGCTARTNGAGVRAFAQYVAPHGYDVIAVQVAGCLHLKTACCALADDVLLLNPEFVDPATFADLDVVTVADREPFGANALPLAGHVVYPEEHVRTAEKLRALGYRLALVPNAELAKLEGGVTCCSLIV